MNKLFFLFTGLIGLLSLSNCKEKGIEVPLDPAIQFATDIELISEYLNLNDYEYTDTTNSGVRVLVLNQGEGGIQVEENAILTFDYTARLLIRDSLDNLSDTTHLTSTIQDVADEHCLRVAPEIVYTYSGSGWTLLSSVSGIQYITGFIQGVTNIMGHLNEGGNGEIIMPSVTAYGPFGTTNVPGNTVLIYEIYLREVDL